MMLIALLNNCWIQARYFVDKRDVWGEYLLAKSIILRSRGAGIKFQYFSESKLGEDNRWGSPEYVQMTLLISCIVK